jgi:hypothetical protein
MRRGLDMHVNWSTVRRADVRCPFSSRRTPGMVDAEAGEPCKTSARMARPAGPGHAGTGDVLGGGQKTYFYFGGPRCK